ncbi:AcrR family transcriptional regulator [Microbacterium testaceum]|uniref:TetR/AcrR family transcriptional regulator n=1 Tax=Microbacterium TaxID=33882 RepID=UPI002782CC6C|nr:MULTISPECIES: TetR/AcrR family transcriptional regulator [Microbacterium]MDQ1111888.1 AcrR family transcriptional regulator [Microbacterium testaceum]MDR6097575.1 AcrR family transcriptional regulator [Microbacterium sp. SORGH_AS_0454]
MPSPAEPVSRRARPAKAPLSRQSILDAAMTLIREHGVDAVTLRHVAAQVETGPASLYAYFGNRDILLEHVLDAAYAQVPLVDADDDRRSWRDALAATIIRTIETLEGYPGLGAVALGTIPVLPGALRLAEHELALMEAGGIPADRAALAVDLIAQFAASTAVERTVRHGRGGTGDERGRVRVAYEHADPESFPRVARSAALLTGPDETARRDFSIEVLLSGIERPG